MVKVRCSDLVIEENIFIGCDNKIISSELIKEQMKYAIDRENYEYAEECRLELLRRKY